MGKHREGGTVATWEPNDVTIFCDLYLEEIELVNMPTTRLSKEGWINVTVKFQEHTGKLFDREQIKNKWHHLKKQWKLWNELKCGETHFGWDPIKKTIDASNEWWTARLQVVPQAKKFRYAGINPELEDRLQKMFSQIVASRSDAWTPNSRASHVESIGENEISDEANDPVEQVVAQGTMNASNDCGDSLRSTQFKKIMEDKKCKQTVDFPLDELAETSRIDGQCMLKARRVGNRSTHYVPTIAEAIEELRKYPEILEDYGLFVYGTLYLRDDVKRELFMCIPDHFKVRWMRNRYKEANNVFSV